MSDPLSNDRLEIDRRLVEAIEAAKRGQVDQPQQIIKEALAAFPTAPNILHKVGVIYRYTGDKDTAIRTFQHLLALHPTFYFTKMEMADISNEGGQTADALGWYLAALEDAPDYPLAYLRAAAMHKRLGQHRAALDLLQELHRRRPKNVDCNIARAELLQFHGDRAQAADALRQALRDGCDDDMVSFNYMRLLTETARYSDVLQFIAGISAQPLSAFLTFHASVFSGHAKLALAADYQRMVTLARMRERWHTVDDMSKQLKYHITHQIPLSLIRLGDGEARFLTYFDREANTLLSTPEKRNILSLMWENWFGGPLSDDDIRTLPALQGAFISAMTRADVLGITTVQRYERDRYHRGYLGVLERTLAKILEWNPTCVLTDAFINTSLHQQSPYYMELLHGLDFIGLVSPHPNLAARLAQHHQIRTYAEYVIPGESRLPSSVRPRNRSQHYPVIYERVCETLAVPRPGAVFLVAAGLLGKIYCNEIKHRGGIALDVGSIVDAWMGYNTRPGQYDDTDSWMLP